MGTSVVKNSRDDAYPAAAHPWQPTCDKGQKAVLPAPSNKWSLCETKIFVCDKRNFSLWEGNSSVTFSSCLCFHVAVQLHKIWYHRISCSTNQFFCDQESLAGCHGNNLSSLIYIRKLFMLSPRQSELKLLKYLLRALRTSSSLHYVLTINNLEKKCIWF